MKVNRSLPIPFGVFEIHFGAMAATRESVRRFVDMKAHMFRSSAMIERACYDETAGSLTMTFRGAGKYVYYDVPAALFDALCRAPSAGRFINEHIKGRFICRRDPDRRRFGPNANAYS